jgi:hypothetical protein
MSDFCRLIWCGFDRTVPVVGLRIHSTWRREFISLLSGTAVAAPTLCPHPLGAQQARLAAWRGVGGGVAQ